MKIRPKVLTKKTVVNMKGKTIQGFRQMSQDSIDLWSKVEELSEEYFGDMLFKPGSTTSKYMEGETQEGTILAGLPEQLEYFSYEDYDFKVRPLPDYIAGYFDDTDGEQVFCINTTHKDDENAILHELIHLHENVLTSFPFFRDVVFMTLYYALKRKVSGLDTVIRDFSNVWNETDLYDQGGEHSILFLLKSLDIDVRKGQKLGTVFGYDLTQKHSQDMVNH